MNFYFGRYKLNIRCCVHLVKTASGTCFILDQDCAKTDFKMLHLTQYIQYCSCISLRLVLIVLSSIQIN